MDDNELYTQLSRVNNELINAKRALLKQNHSLNSQHEKFKVTLASIADAVIVVNSNWEITFYNRAASELTYLKPEEAERRELGELISFIDSKREKVNLSDLSSDVINEGKKNIEVCLELEETVIPVELKVSSLRNENGDVWGFVIVIHDLRPRKKIESEQEELNEMLRLLNKILRHDILNDLNVIKLALDVFEIKNDRKYLDKCKISLEKSANLIENMYILENIVSTGKELEKYEVASLIEKITPAYDIEINVRGNCTVLADQALSSVFDNLIKNAIIHGKTERIDINIEQESRMSRIHLKDYGKGIPDEIKSEIFNNEFKYGESGHTGLGLYIVKKVIERYGGTISVKDSRPHGTCFIIQLKVPS